MQLVTTIKGDFDLLTTDHIGRLYVTKGSEVFLYSKEGELKFRYSSLNLGDVTFLDTRNPLKLLLFYKDYSQITFLDNSLSETRGQTLDLNKMNLATAQLACTSFDNGFWVYNPINFQLLRYSQSMRISNEVSNINQLVGADINPNQMLEDDNWVYMNDPEYGVFVFDSFGTYSKLIPIPGAKQIQVRGNSVFLETEEGLIKYNLETFDQIEIELPIENWKMLRIEKDCLYLLTDAGVLIYQNVDE
ncbi:hypothetical protein ACFLR1_00845 [Bacteroidota bacterium]